jgi:hypothetical protein
MSGLKINFMKSEVLCIGGDNDIAKSYSELFHCQIGSFPMKYLGVPVSATGLKESDWDFIDMRFIKKNLGLGKVMVCPLGQKRPC